MRCPNMLPVISAWLALFSSLLRSRWTLHLQVLALQHQVAVYQQTIDRPRLSAMDRVFWSWLSWFWSGWQNVLAFVQPPTSATAPDALLCLLSPVEDASVAGDGLSGASPSPCSG